MLNRPLLLLFIFLSCVLNSFAQRNNFKLLGYTFNNNFAKPILLNNYNYDFNNINHSFSIGYERTIGNKMAVTLNYFKPLGFNANQVNVNSNANSYLVDQKVTGWGIGLNTRLYLQGLDNGAPNGKYLEFGYIRYGYSNLMTLRQSSTGPSNPIYLGSLNNSIVINKVGLKYGIEKISSNVLFDLFVGIDYNMWNANFDKTHMTAFDKTDYQKSISVSIGLMVGFNL